MRRLLHISCALAALLFAVMSQSTPALAHEHRTLGGKYDVVVGWDKEPAFANQPNAAGISITKADTKEPVEGLEKTLKVSIAFGGREAKEFPLRTVFGRKGYYVADILPTKSGSFIFTFRGDIEGTPVNERFESGPGRFDDVDSTDAMQLPDAVPDTAALANDLKAARDEANGARTLAVAGLVAGVLGLVAGGAALLTRRAPAK